ncbi:hypothetical protein E2C01_068730 [Portunus trituberculatus]|uniref:Uncharacterized protein n=1 Tax=Portunus trituberculatus TaxID=210409 RepID=A0A5B7HWQ0_PORTR|nr:hypothetical protein [Portunus trituberculatus]
MHKILKQRRCAFCHANSYHSQHQHTIKAPPVDQYAVPSPLLTGPPKAAGPVKRGADPDTTVQIAPLRTQGRSIHHGPE